MDATKIFVAEQDCESLVNTMLWLEQYADFEVYGTEASGELLNEQIAIAQPDVIIFALHSATTDAARAIKLLKSSPNSPALLLANKTGSNVEFLAGEVDGQIGPRTTLKEMPELIRKALVRRTVGLPAPVSMPMAKAG